MFHKEILRNLESFSHPELCTLLRKPLNDVSLSLFHSKPLFPLTINMRIEKIMKTKKKGVLRQII